MMFLDCPAYLDQDGAVRCGLPADGHDGADGFADRRKSLREPVSRADCLCSATVNEGQLARFGQRAYGASGTGPSDSNQGLSPGTAASTRPTLHSCTQSN